MSITILDVPKPKSNIQKVKDLAKKKARELLKSERKENERKFNVLKKQSGVRFESCTYKTANGTLTKDELIAGDFNTLCTRTFDPFTGQYTYEFNLRAQEIEHL